jgi:hypothetical protein
MSTNSVEDILVGHDKKEYQTRRAILMKVWMYIWYKYKENGALDKDHSDAVQIISDRYNYQHHYTKGF